MRARTPSKHQRTHPLQTPTSDTPYLMHVAGEFFDARAGVCMCMCVRVRIRTRTHTYTRTLLSELYVVIVYPHIVY